MTDRLTDGAPATAPRKVRQTNDFTQLAKLIGATGLLRRRYGYYWTRLIGAVVVLAAAIAAFILIGDTWWQLFTAAGLAILFTQIAMLGHDAAHRQIFVSGRWNDWTCGTSTGSPIAILT